MGAINHVYLYHLIYFIHYFELILDPIFPENHIWQCKIRCVTACTCRALRYCFSDLKLYSPQEQST